MAGCKPARASTRVREVETQGWERCVCVCVRACFLVFSLVPSLTRRTTPACTHARKRTHTHAHARTHAHALARTHVHARTRIPRPAALPPLQPLPTCLRRPSFVQENTLEIRPGLYLCKIVLKIAPTLQQGNKKTVLEIVLPGRPRTTTQQTTNLLMADSDHGDTQGGVHESEASIARVSELVP
jgi:hypothetical protein